MVSLPLIEVVSNHTKYTDIEKMVTFTVPQLCFELDFRNVSLK